MYTNFSRYKFLITGLFLSKGGRGMYINKSLKKKLDYFIICVYINLQPSVEKKKKKKWGR